MKSIITLLEQINERIGRLFSWTTTLLVITLCFDVFMRYVLKKSFIWLSEIEIYLFALSFLFGAGYTLKHDKHVRVDIFYDKLNLKNKSWVNIFGAILFLMPWCIVSIIACWKYAMFSFSFKENSPQAGGLPYLFILKFCILACFVLLLIQGIASVLKSIHSIRNSKVKE